MQLVQVVSSTAASTAASAAGVGLAGAALALAALRRFAAKPLHPRGEIIAATLTRTGRRGPGSVQSGVSWIDEEGVDAVTVRRSRAVGLPEPLPDIYGVALRTPAGPGRDADILLATTGWGRIGRFVLVPTRDASARSMTTLLPYRTSRGPVILGAEPLDGGSRLRLSWATPTGPWHPFAMLDLDAPSGHDARIAFDPILRPVPGLDTYGWTRRLREPAYAIARFARSRRSTTEAHRFASPPGEI